MVAVQTLNSLHADVVQWAKSRGIFATTTPMQQAFETFEKIWEATDALNGTGNPEMELGNILVTLAIGAHMQGGKTLPQCMAAAPINGPAQSWLFVGEWFRRLQYALDGREQNSPIPLIGAVANCAADACRAHLGKSPEDCLAMAVAKIKRNG